MSLRGLKKLKTKNDARAKNAVLILKKSLTRAGMLVENTAKESIKQKGTGRTYTKYNPSRTHTASAPNLPPATDTGYLGANISLKVESRFDGSVAAMIVSSAEYSKALEYGTVDMEPRPFMRPALNNNRGKIRKILKARGVIDK